MAGDEEKISKIKKELMKYFDELKNSKDKDTAGTLKALLYLFYPDIEKEYKKMKKGAAVASADQNKIAELRAIYPEVAKQCEQYVIAADSLAKINQKISTATGGKSQSMEDAERFSKLNGEIGGLKSKMGKDKDAAIAAIKKGVIDSLGIDDANAQAIVSDNTKLNTIATASGDYVRAKGLGIANAIKFMNLVADAFGADAARTDFVTAYNYAVSMIGSPRDMRMGRGDDGSIGMVSQGPVQVQVPQQQKQESEYSQEFVKSYIETYNKKFDEGFDLPDYVDPASGKDAFSKATSKKQYGNALAILCDLRSKVDVKQEMAELGNVSKDKIEKFADALDIVVKYPPSAAYERMGAFDGWENFVSTYRSDRESVVKVIVALADVCPSPRFLHCANLLSMPGLPESGYMARFYNNLTRMLFTVIPFSKSSFADDFKEKLKKFAMDRLKSFENTKKQHGIENYPNARNLVEKVNRIIESAKNLGFLEEKTYEELSTYMEKEVIPMFKEGEKQFMEEVEKGDLPEDQYAGKDKDDIKKMTIKTYEGWWPDVEGKCVGVILECPDWKIMEEEKFIVQGNALVKYMYQYRWMSAYVIADKGDLFYWGYGVGIRSEILQNSFGNPFASGELDRGILFLSKKKVKDAGLLMK